MLRAAATLADSSRLRIVAAGFSLLKQVAILVRGNNLGMSKTCLTMKTLASMMLMTPSNFLMRMMPLLRQPCKTRLNDATRNKKKAKLGLPDCNWLKPLQLDNFVVSTIPKDVIRVDAATQKTHKLWLEATALLTAIIVKVDASDIDQAEAIQRIKSRPGIVRKSFSTSCHSTEKSSATTPQLSTKVTSKR